jgi:hypothetical protein
MITGSPLQLQVLRPRGRTKSRTGAPAGLFHTDVDRRAGACPAH